MIEYDEFKSYFTNAFGKLMLNKSFAGIIARQIKDKEFNLPFFNQPISAIALHSLLSAREFLKIKMALIVSR